MRGSQIMKEPTTCSQRVVCYFFTRPNDSFQLKSWCMHTHKQAHTQTHRDQISIFSVHVNRGNLEFPINQVKDQIGDFCTC